MQLAILKTVLSIRYLWELNVAILMHRCIIGATTFSIMTLTIMTFSIMTLSIMTLSRMTLSRITLSITTFSIMTFSIKGLLVTLRINNIRHY
jgi:hypothetical protein